MEPDMIWELIHSFDTATLKVTIQKWHTQNISKSTPKDIMEINNKVRNGLLY